LLCIGHAGADEACLRHKAQRQQLNDLRLVLPNVKRCVILLKSVVGVLLFEVSHKLGKLRISSSTDVIVKMEVEVPVTSTVISS